MAPRTSFDTFRGMLASFRASFRVRGRKRASPSGTQAEIVSGNVVSFFSSFSILFFFSLLSRSSRVGVRIYPNGAINSRSMVLPLFASSLLRRYNAAAVVLPAPSGFLRFSFPFFSLLPSPLPPAPPRRNSVNRIRVCAFSMPPRIYCVADGFLSPPFFPMLGAIPCQ